MAGKRRENSQLYGIIALVAVVVVFVWAMVQMLNQNKVTTESKARLRNNSRFPTIARSPTIPNTFTCDKKCDPATDSGCPTNFICVDVNSGKKDFPPDYRCLQYLRCREPRPCFGGCPRGETCHDGACW